MGAGDLNRRVRLLRAVALPGELADDVQWMTFGAGGADGCVWASHTPALDGERMRAAQTGASLTDRFLVKWRPEIFDLSPRDQLEFDDVRYQITHVKPVGVRDRIEITAVAHAEAGVR
jgi:hypothetical protein